MATIGNNARKRESQEATAKELVEEVYREWQIRGGNPRNREMTNPTEKPRQYCLVDKAMKEARIATIVGQRIIDGTSASFYKKETRNREVTMTRRFGHSTDTVCNHCGKKGHQEKDCWIKHPHLKKNRQGASVETDIIVSIIEQGDSNEQNFEAENAPQTMFSDGFELEDKNLTQMKFPEVKKLNSKTMKRTEWISKFLPQF